MSGRRLWVAIGSLLPILVASCVSGPAVTGPEKLYGTWTNHEYFGTYWSHTITWYPDGRQLWYEKRDVESPTGESRVVIDRTWVDATGSTWYRLKENWSYLPFNAEAAANSTLYELVRINPSGDTLESEGSPADWPAAFGALGGHHFVYHRLQGVEKLHGSWVDRAFVGQTLAYRYVYRPDGSVLAFAGAESGTPSMEGRYTIERTWTDGSGFTWFRVASRWAYLPYNEEAAAGNRWFALVRISPDGATLETEHNQVDFPPEFGAMGNLHRVFNRQ